MSAPKTKPSLTVLPGGLSAPKLSAKFKATLPKRSLAREAVWDSEFARLQRRLEKIAALKRGDATIKKVSVGGGWVRRHYRDPHTRYLIRLRSDKK